MVVELTDYENKQVTGGLYLGTATSNFISFLADSSYIALLTMGAFALNVDSMDWVPKPTRPNKRLPYYKIFAALVAVDFICRVACVTTTYVLHN